VQVMVDEGFGGNTVCFGGKNLILAEKTLILAKKIKNARKCRSKIYKKICLML
jgi:ribosomal protein L16/L10AE